MKKTIKILALITVTVAAVKAFERVKEKNYEGTNEGKLMFNPYD